VVVVAALLASLFWGAADFIGGTLSRRYAALAVAGGAQAIGLLVLLIPAVGGGAAVWSAGALFWGFWAGILAITGLALMYTALATGAMGIVSPIIAMSAVVAVMAGIAFGETPTALQAGAILACLAGIVLVTLSPGAGPRAQATRKPILLAALAAVTFGGSLVLLALGSDYDPLAATVSMRAAATASALIAAMVVRTAGGLDRRALLPILALGALDAGAYFAFGWASAAGELTSVSILSALYPLETAMLAYVFHHERLRPTQIIGAATCLVGVIALVA